MAKDYLLRLGMTADEALSIAVKKVDAAETWEQLAKDWKRIQGGGRNGRFLTCGVKDIVTTLRELFQFRKNRRRNRKLSAGNKQRALTLIHLCTRINLLRDNYLSRHKDDSMSAQELKSFMADWGALSDPELNCFMTDAQDLKSFMADWEPPLDN